MGKKPRGFAMMDPERQREIARKGGQSIPAAKRKGFATMTPEQIRKIARLGGQSVPAECRSFSRDHELAAAAGRKGGTISRKKKREEGF